jgi:RND superfamily putative drug exporter
VAAALAGLSTQFGGVFRDELTVPHSDSQRAVEILEAKFPASAGSAVRIVFRTAVGSVHDPAAANAIRASLAEVLRGRHVVAVDDPLAPGAPRVSPDGAIALATVTYDLPAADLGAPVLDHLERAVAPGREAGLQVEFGGELLDYVAPLEGSLGEGIGLLAAAVILVLAFGYVVAAVLPLVTAVVSLTAGLSVVSLLAAHVAISTAAPTLAAMLALGVGIDYALFIVSPYREHLGAGSQAAAAAGASMATAGRAVLLAGGTVICSILGL